MVKICVDESFALSLVVEDDVVGWVCSISANSLFTVSSAWCLDAFEVKDIVWIYVYLGSMLYELGSKR